MMQAEALEEGLPADTPTSDHSSHPAAESDPGSDLEERSPPSNPAPPNPNAGPGEDSDDPGAAPSEDGGSDSEDERAAAEDPGDSDDDPIDAPQAAPAAEDPGSLNQDAEFFSMMQGDGPVFKGAEMSVRQFVYAALNIKQDGRQNNVCFNQWLTLIKHLLQPISPGKTNRVPASLVRCNTIMGVKKLAGCTWDTCACGQHAWDPAGPKSPADKCPFKGCRTSRWKDSAPGAPLVPRQVRWRASSGISEPRHAA